MAIGSDYSQPVFVNGFQCWNCSQVAEAKQGVDPAHPKSGPWGIDAASDPTRAGASGGSAFGPAVQASGAAASALAAAGPTSAGTPYAPGALVTLQA